MDNLICCLCGAPRRPTQAPVESFGNNVQCISMRDHRPMLSGKIETHPQMLVNVCLWRNGGTAYGRTHICEDCLKVGLEEAKRFVDGALNALRTPEMTK